ncbi:hypothetical protein EVAR_52783_1 [Eumeta japonica]|uniref:Uncharacterized protein n=1 Tax=Eumeta variegata TaxID=151549 RepID=A0A4C1Z806_EUMVA|nr:hypothetical protein EVAR_52783_1 [Eumeta japonica]
MSCSGHVRLKLPDARCGAGYLRLIVDGAIPQDFPLKCLIEYGKSSNVFLQGKFNERHVTDDSDSSALYSME